MQAHPASLGISDVSECWPSCPPQFSGTELEKSYRAAICPAGSVPRPRAETAEHATPLPAAGEPGQQRRGRKERGVRKEVHMRPVPEPVPLAGVAVGLPFSWSFLGKNLPPHFAIFKNLKQDWGPADHAVSLLEAIPSETGDGRQDNGVSLGAIIATVQREDDAMATALRRRRRMLRKASHVIGASHTTM